MLKWGLVFALLFTCLQQQAFSYSDNVQGQHISSDPIKEFEIFNVLHLTPLIIKKSFKQNVDFIPSEYVLPLFIQRVERITHSYLSPGLLDFYHFDSSPRGPPLSIG